MVKRLIDKTKRRDFNDKTDREFAKLVAKYSPAETVKSISVTVILFREKDEYDPKKQKQDNDTTVNIRFAKGTTVADALEQKGELRKLGNALPKKIKYAKNLMQFYTGAFDLNVDEATVSYLRDEVSEMMLLRSDDETKHVRQNSWYFYEKQYNLSPSHGYNR